MNAPSKLIAFAGVLGLAFGGAMLAGAMLNPTMHAVGSSSDTPNLEGNLT